MLVDPFDKDTGLSIPRSKTDIVLKTITKAVTVEDDKPLGGFADDSFVINGPGSYEVKGVGITGWQLVKNSNEKESKAVYRVKFGDLVLGFLGHISEFNDAEIIEELDEIDILFIPGGNAPYISQEVASKLIRQIEPRLIIPTHYAVQGLKRKADNTESFVKAVGAKAEQVDKLSIKKKDLPEKTEIRIFTL